MSSFLADKSAKVFVVGHRGMVGSAIHRKLAALGFTNLVVRTRDNLDLTCQPAIDAFFDTEHPRYVILAAAKVGGVHASSAAPDEYLTQNLRVTVNVVTAAQRTHVIPALIRRFHQCKVYDAPEIVVWGSGVPLCEFTHVDDLADAVVVLIVIQ